MNTTSMSLLIRLREPASKAAWDRFVQLYTPLLYQLAYRMGAGDPEAADLVQDTFVILLDKLPAFQYDRRQRFRGWLWTLMLNLWRQRRRRAVLAPSQLPDEQLHELAGDESMNEIEETEYRQYLVLRALRLMQGEFEEKTWKACWGSVVEDRKPAEVARDLGLTVNAVYVAKSRVLRRLHEELKGLLD